jgi:anti-sigma factor RsiW
MATCDHRRDLLWDYVYDLVDPGEAAALRAHLASCPACQAALEQVTAQQKLIAQAAQLDVPIPPFTVPAAEPETVSRPARRPVVRSRRLPLWPMLAAAAAVLLAVGLPYGLYQRGLASRQQLVRDAHEHINQLVREEEEFSQQTALAEQTQIRDLRARHVCIQVFGPAEYQPEAPNRFRIQTTDLDGQPVAAQINARLLGAGQPVPVAAATSQKPGEYVVSLPSELTAAPHSTARLEVVAQARGDREELQQALRVGESAYTTHLIVDRAVYHAGERILFEFVALTRFSLRPPAQTFAATYSLLDPVGNVLVRLAGPTRDGMGSGVLAIPENGPEGSYRVIVTEAQNRFPAAVRDITVRSRSSARKGNETLADGPRIEFFPEGGDLVAGLASRVYFRARDAAGQPLSLQGQVEDSQGRSVVAIQTANRGLGVFTLTPQAGQKYHLRLTSPAPASVKLPLPSPRSEGIVLSVPTGVLAPNEDVEAILENAGAARAVVAVVLCRGRSIAEETITLPRGQSRLHLHPTESITGLLCVKVFESGTGALRPLAERLVYRVPPQRLRLAAQSEKRSYRPGDRVQLMLGCTTETGKTESAWLRVSVVDQKDLHPLHGITPPSLPADFYLASELPHPEAVDRADELVGDPAQAAALDLVLGTQRGRPVQEQEPSTTLVQRDNTSQVARKASAAITQAVVDLRHVADLHEQELTGEHKVWLGREHEAETELDAFEAWADDEVRLAIGATVIVLLGAGCVLLVGGLVRLVRGRSGNVRYFAGALGTLALCLCSLLALGDRRGNRPPLARHTEEPGPLVRGKENGLPVAVPHAMPHRGNGSDLDKQAMPMVIKPAPARNEGPRPGPIPSISGVPLRSDSYLETAEKAGPVQGLPETVLWQPIRVAADGRAQVSFELPRRAATYAIHVEGHSASGRLGAILEKIEVK